MQNGGEATTEQVWQMVQMLNNVSTTPDDRKKADNWLKEYQRSKGAWSTLDQLLRAQGLDPTGQFFAAQTLKSKVRKDMHQLEPADRDGMASSLMTYIHTFRNGPLNVRTQLCLAFSAYAGEFDRGAKADIVQNVCAALGSSAETVPSCWTCSRCSARRLRACKKINTTSRRMRRTLSSSRRAPLRCLCSTLRISALKVSPRRTWSTGATL